MKKILLFSVAMLIGVASFAQKKGDMYIAGSISADFGTQKSIFYIMEKQMSKSIIQKQDKINPTFKLEN